MLLQLITSAVALLWASSAMTSEPTPRWVSELPVVPGCHFAIGECGNFTDKTTASREARQLGAFRLAAAMSVTIRYGLAATQDGRSANEYSFGEVGVDTTMMQQIEASLVVIDSVQLEDGLHLLVAHGNRVTIPQEYFQRNQLRVALPEWVKTPPTEAGAAFGLGSSWKSGVYGWEDAERNARVAVAQQVVINVRTRTWSQQSSAFADQQQASNQTSTLTLVNAQVVQRAKDEDGVAYVLVRMPIPSMKSNR